MGRGHDNSGDSVNWDNLAHELRTRCRWSGGKLNHYQDPCGKCDRCRAADRIEELEEARRERRSSTERREWDRRTICVHDYSRIRPERRVLDHRRTNPDRRTDTSTGDEQ